MHSIKVLFFAHLRELSGISMLSMTLTPAFFEGQPTALDLINHIPLQPNATEKMKALPEQLIQTPNLRCAINQRMAKLTDPIAPHDEIAFFPPVTGG